MFYLASHYGKYQTLLDSVKGTNDGKLVFKKDQKYVEGIYMLVTTDKKIELEFLMDTNQKFNIQVTNPTEKTLAIQNSPLNQDFNNFNSFFRTKMEGIKALEKTLADKKSKQDSALVIKDLKKIKCPALVIAGDDDMASLKHTGEIYEAIENSRLAIIPGASHLIDKDQPDLLNKVIRIHTNRIQYNIQNCPKIYSQI